VEAKMNVKRLSATAVALLATSAIAAAGCGGDDDDSDSGLETSDLSKTEWIAKADQICGSGDAEIGRQAEEFFKGKPTPEVETQFTEQVVIPNIESQVDQLRDLGAPEGDEDQVQKMLDTVDEGLTKVESDPSALEQGALNPGTALAQQYGLKVCGADDGE
jgi:hypothetical protein